jgi:hypothetical protein
MGYLFWKKKGFNGDLICWIEYMKNKILNSRDSIVDNDHSQEGSKNIDIKMKYKHNQFPSQSIPLALDF